MSDEKCLSELHNIEIGQDIKAHEPTERASSSIDNPKVRSEINYRLLNELNDIILSPENGVQRIRKVLHRYGLDIPALYEIDVDGDEVVFGLNQFGDVIGPSVEFGFDEPTENEEPDAYLYMIYYLTDEGTYEFYAEVTDEEGLEEILAEDEDDEEEEQ